jgi:hypothetical protein
MCLCVHVCMSVSMSVLNLKHVHHIAACIQSMCMGTSTTANYICMNYSRSQWLLDRRRQVSAHLAPCAARVPPGHHRSVLRPRRWPQRCCCGSLRWRRSWRRSLGWRRSRCDLWAAPPVAPRRTRSSGPGPRGSGWPARPDYSRCRTNRTRSENSHREPGESWNNQIRTLIRGCNVDVNNVL